MQYFSIKILFCLLLIGFHTTYGYKKNAIKTNTGCHLIGFHEIYYERLLKNHISGQLDFGSWKISNFNLFSITPAIKLYFNNEAKMTGSYLNFSLNYMQENLKKNKFNIIKPMIIIGNQWTIGNVLLFDFFIGATYNWINSKINIKNDIHSLNTILNLEGFFGTIGFNIGIIF